MTHNSEGHPGWVVAPTPVRRSEAAALLREYYVEVADRYRLLHLGRRSTPTELERELAADSADDLIPPRGLFLLGRYDGEPAACAGLRALGDDVVELTRVFVRPQWRGTGGGQHLLIAAETAATALGATRVVLDTRLDLVEARALYRRHGYAEIPAYNTGDYAEIWYGKSLSPQPRA
ncbi:GNAT family N-acetyltransferase [Nocardia sp. NPDC056100]|uniref:GNAT family N-acetyltransferase n=1 Tax=Nocardia sp. NPDC056100 TaxID=3345712 RepID=UPI0035D76859